jgi:hypothetical protein
MSLSMVDTTAAGQGPDKPPELYENILLLTGDAYWLIDAPGCEGNG